MTEISIIFSQVSSFYFITIIIVVKLYKSVNNFGIYIALMIIEQVHLEFPRFT